MTHRIFRSWSGAACVVALSSIAPAAASEPPAPPEIPGHAYIRSLDGCGVVLKGALDPANAEAVTRMYAGRHWIGNCVHGLADGFGYWIDPAMDSFMQVWPGLYVLGQEQLTRATIVQSAGISEFLSAGASVQYMLSSDDHKAMNQAVVPAIWNIDDPYTPFYTSNNGSALDDFSFSLSEGEGEKRRMTIFSVGARNCVAAGRKIRGCRAVFEEFDVYGVSVTTTQAGAESTDQFTLCPQPTSTEGCETVWRQVAGPHLDKAVVMARDTRARLLQEIGMAAQSGEAAEAVLPAGWKAHWAQHPVQRPGAEAAARCLGISDFHPVSAADAMRVREKYSTAPCNAAVTAAIAVSAADRFVAIDAKGKQQETAIRDSYALARAERDAENAQAWAGFLGNLSTMIGAYAATQAPATGNSDYAAAVSPPVPAYQSYGQPPASAPSSGGKSYTRAIHKPELDAQSCVSLVQLSEGDPLTSFGSQVFANRCGETVEVFWCKVGDECERGAGGMTTVAAGKSWPVTSGHYRWGACKGANSGSLQREANGQHTGRYACTGP
jgi:hypothetical protein